MRPIIFTTGKRTNSFFYRALQMCQFMQSIGIDAKCVKMANLGDVNGSIIHVIKYSHPSFLEPLAEPKHDNKLVFDCIDCFSGKATRESSVSDIFDGVIFCNSMSMKDHSGIVSSRSRKIVIHHHADPRIKIGSHTKFSTCYIGHGNKAMMNFYSKNFGADTFSTVRRNAHRVNWLDAASSHAMHLSLRCDPVLVKYKPSTKLIVAAAAGSNIMTTAESGFLDLAPLDEYPFYCGRKLPAMLKTLEFAKRNFGGRLWKQGLDVMKRVREKTSLKFICNDLIQFYKTL